MSDSSPQSTATLSDLPIDELLIYAQELGLPAGADTPRGELLRRVRQRQELLVELDRNAMLDVVIWARLPVRRSAGKEALAKQIATVTKTRFDTLSDRGLKALARLGDIEVDEAISRETLERRLRHRAGWWRRVQRHRRRFVGSLISRLVEHETHDGEYRFLPEEQEGSSLKETIADAGVVGGIAQKLRGAADHYVHQKLDEIERRIDRKLDEIDRRLGEWRDREIRNRLRIVKITLIAAIIVAVISLGYDVLRARVRSDRPTEASMTMDRPANHSVD